MESHAYITGENLNGEVTSKKNSLGAPQKVDTLTQKFHSQAYVTQEK